jgi:hypothetical protein
MDRTLKTMREVTKTAQLQRRHFVLWLLIVLFAGGLFFMIKNASLLFADTPEIIEETSITGSNVDVEVTVRSDGVAIVHNKPTTKIFRPLSEFDEFKYKLVDKPGYFISRLAVRVTFEEPLPAKTKVIAFAVHGIDSHTEKQIDENTIEYVATDIGPEALYTVAAELPKGSIDWPWWRVVAAVVDGLPISFWLTLAALLPMITAIVLLVMFFPNLRIFIGRPAGELPAPPSDLPAALVGILIHGRVSAREIAATIMDLANRGYLTIFDKGNGQFSFGKRRGWQNLCPYELLLLEQIFANTASKPVNQQTSSEHDIELGVGGSLFSSQIAAIYVAMYDAATAAGYFKKNPAQIHQFYRMIGLFLFFVALGAFGAALLVDLQPSYLLFFFAGMMTMALIIIVAADDVPLLTQQGEAARWQWLQFGNHLRNYSLINYTEGAQAHYERYLPYAVVTSSELEWVNRFRNHPFGVPSWYDSSEKTIPIQDFAASLHKIVGSIAQLFSSVKEPHVQ